MRLSSNDVTELKSILAACKVLGIDGVVIHEGLARGAKPTLDAAIISQAKLSISEALRLGIGRVAELEKRLAIFPGQVEIEGRCNEAGDVSLLTLSSGKSKVQFRCTSVNLMRYPKANEDQPFAVITLNRAEVAQVVKAVRTLGAEKLVLQVARTGAVRLECSDSANDRFDIELEVAAEFVEGTEGAVQTYLADLFVSLVDASFRGEAEGAPGVSFTLGAAGSITSTVHGHNLLLMPQITSE